jgi:hypothetical protein
VPVCPPLPLEEVEAVSVVPVEGAELDAEPLELAELLALEDEPLDWELPEDDCEEPLWPWASGSVYCWSPAELANATGGPASVRAPASASTPNRWRGRDIASIISKGCCRSGR